MMHLHHPNSKRVRTSFHTARSTVRGWLNTRMRQGLAAAIGTVAAFLACCAVVCVCALNGCSGPTAGPEPPSGGRAFVLDYNTFATVIDPILTAQGCDNVACHGGGIRGTFELSPNTQKNLSLDFSQASLQVTPTDFAASPLLMKPLAESAGGAAHAATPAQFASTDDPDYQAILSWIEAGVYR
jgi:hypothetical protein